MALRKSDSQNFFDTPEFNKIKLELERKNEFEFLSKQYEKYVWNHYLLELTTMFTIAKEKGVNPEDNEIFEFGALQSFCQLRINSYPSNPSIAHFFALSQAQNYFAIDKNHSQKKLKRIINLTKKQLEDEEFQRIFPHSGFSQYKNIDLKLLEERINTISLDYTQAQERIIEKSKKRKSIIFSNNVFNDPEIDKTLPYWNLPGLHVHIAGKNEIEKIKCSRSIFDPKNPSQHINQLKKYLNIDANIEAFIIPSRSDRIVYVWEK